MALASSSGVGSAVLTKLVYQIFCCRYLLIWFIAGDDVVPYKFGEKSSQALSSTGYQNVAFKAYNGYVI